MVAAFEEGRLGADPVLDDPRVGDTGDANRLAISVGGPQRPGDVTR
jgi:hypothetical protein